MHKMLGGPMGRVAALALTLAAALVLPGCGGDDDGERVAAPLPNEPGGWTRFVPQSATIDGDRLTPTCSKAPGSKADFHFWARRGSSNKLVVFFEGGGACWDGATCALPITAATRPTDPALYKAEILPTDDPTQYAGVFKLDDAANPMKDWSIVYVPYCTGDIHSGSKTASYVNPFTQQPYQIEHRGADNFRLVLHWMQQNFVRPEQVLVTGSSAGAYGATTHYPRIRTAFPAARAAMLGDAGQGVVPAAWDAVRNANWNFQLDAQVYGANAQSTPTTDIVRRLAAAYPGDRFAQYTTATDLVQIQFYDVQSNGLSGTQGTACQAWTEGMLAGLATQQAVPNYRSYVAAGTTHTLLRGTSRDAAGVPLFNREASAGVRFTDWLGALLSDSGSGWANRACADCGTLPACPF
jgi:hypothetical protein